MDLGTKPKLTKTQRLNQRWNRVQCKLQKKLAKQNGDNNASKVMQAMNINNDDNESQTKLQIKSSRNIVDDKAQSITQNVADIKLLSEMKASNRRKICSTENESRMFRLEQCIEKGRELNTKIDSEWNDLTKITNPQNLYNGINETKIKCKQLIFGYESTRKQFMSEFKKKSEHYVSLLKSQENDVTEMIWRMHENIKRIKDEYECQIIEVEKAFMKERRQIIDSNQKDLDLLISKRQKQEFLILNQKMSDNDKYHIDLDRVRSEDQQSYNKLKINLENHIQILEQQLEEMRAMYQLNTEKLNYNFQVLKEREKENITSVDHLKRREKKLKEIVANVKEKFIKTDKKKKSEFKVLNDEYNRISVQYKELQRKFKHFELSDMEKYQQICDMNREEAIGVLTEIMKCDQIICTQLLGIEWNKNQWNIPSDLLKNDFFSTIANNAFHTEILTTFAAITGSDGEDVLIKNDDLSMQKQQEITPKNADCEKNKICQSKYSNEQILSVIKLLITEAPFLISSSESVNNLSSDQRLLFECDAIFKSLGIEDIEDMEALCSLFLCDSFKPHQTIQIVKKYLSNRDNSKTADIHTSNYSVKHALTAANREKAERRKRKDNEYWKMLQCVFPKICHKTWSLLEGYLEKYIKILEKRKDEATKIINLQNENLALRDLLKQYLSSDANKELIIPPSLIIDALNR